MKLNPDLRLHRSAESEISLRNVQLPRVIRWYPWVRAGIRWHCCRRNWPLGAVTTWTHPGRHGSARPRHARSLGPPRTSWPTRSVPGQGDGCGWCRRPIRLRGYVVSSDADGRHITYTSASLPDGVFLKACGSRSEVRCPACAQVYRGDARHLVRAGLEGGKGVSEAVAGNPAVFLTLTAPRLWCRAHHQDRWGLSQRAGAASLRPRSPQRLHATASAERRDGRHAALPGLL